MTALVYGLVGCLVSVVVIGGSVWISLAVLDRLFDGR